MLNGNIVMMPETAPLPSLFLPHGAPTFALHPGQAGVVMAELAAHLPRPRAVVVVSAHWGTHEPCVGFAEHPATIHDFWGFPDELYAIRYPAHGSTRMAAEVLARLREAGFDASSDSQRGLDHGAWIPLRCMYPDADVPVIPLSIQPRLSPTYHFALGRALAPLADEGCLILASGNLTHNLGEALRPQPGSNSPDYVREFSEWFWQRLQAHDLAALLDYRKQAPQAVRAHPRDEHLLPLFVALGVHADGDVARVHSGVEHHSIAMDAFVFQAETSS
jgi:4,5-DOPA dioxygenase extradiol